MRRHADGDSPSAHGRAGEKGFALVTVIWGLGLIALLIVSFITSARLRLQTAFNIASAAQAGFIADAALGETILSLLLERESNEATTFKPLHAGEPRICSIAGALVAIIVEDEGGKLDLNGASQSLLYAALVGFGLPQSEADSIASAVVAFRMGATSELDARNADYEGADKPFGPKQAPFQTIFELDQVAGVSPSLFRGLAPFVTVHSHSAGVDARTAPPALFAALASFSQDDVQGLIATPFPNSLDRRDPRYPARFNQNGDSGAMLAHVEVILPTGQTSVREAIVDFRNVLDAPHAIRELRRGSTRVIDRLRTTIQDGAMNPPDCG